MHFSSVFVLYKLVLSLFTEQQGIQCGLEHRRFVRAAYNSSALLVRTVCCTFRDCRYWCFLLLTYVSFAFGNHHHHHIRLMNSK